MFSFWSKFKNNETAGEKFIEGRILSIINDKNFKSKTEFIDEVRNFVYHNSVNSIKEMGLEHDESAWNITYVLEKIYLSAKGAEFKPYLSCGPRAFAMRAILSDAGIESRIVLLFSDDFDSLEDHTVLEVFNPDTLMWEIQDPDSNSYYIDETTKKRISIAELILDNKESVQLVSDEEKEKDWQKTIMAHYFDGAMYSFAWTRRSKSVVIYNPERFSASKEFPLDNNLTFFEIVKEKYENPAVISNLENSIEFESIFYDL